MKIKKTTIISIFVVICICVLGIMWNIKSKSLKSSYVIKTTNSDTSNKSKDTVSKNGENAEQVKTESSDKVDDETQSEVSANSSTSASISKSAAILKAELESQQSKSESENASKPQLQTFTGYITTEDDFAVGLKEDTAAMIYMKMMALSGLGITFQENGEWIFYYFDGNISTDNKDGEGETWIFNGTGSQLNAWNIVEEQIKSNNGSNKMSPVPVTVTGILDGSLQTNPGFDADGKKFSVIKVQSIIKN